MAHFLLPTTTTLLILLFFSPSLTITMAEPALDTNGQPIEANVGYYLRPVGVSGGVTLIKKEGPMAPACPLLGLSSSDKGKPVKFIPLNPNPNNIIGLSEDFNVETLQTISDDTCNSSVWALMFNPTNIQIDIMTGGRVRDTSFKSAFNFFKIEKVNTISYDADDQKNVYKISRCPSFRPEYPLCADLNVFRADDGNTYLDVNTRKYLTVQFERAEPSSVTPPTSVAPKLINRRMWPKIDKYIEILVANNN